MTKREETIRLSDGRLLALAEFGQPGGAPVLYCHGFPGSRREAELTAGAAARLGLRLIAPDRPGFGLSDRRPGRTLADWPRDVAELAAMLDLPRFGVLGVSGGAPYALACAALLPQHVTAATVVCGLGPPDHAGSTAGMTPLSRLMLLVFRFSPTLGCALYLPLAQIVRKWPRAVFFLLTGAAPPQDRRTLTRPEVRRILIGSYREAFRRGVLGGARELCLYSRPWDFPVEGIAVPVEIWHGEKDVTVPVSMGRQLARTLPHARAVFLPEEGHFSLPVERAEEILSFLRARS